MIDMAGQRIGRLQVISYDLDRNRELDKNHSSNAYWNVRCDCGSTYSMRGNSLRRAADRFGDLVSCRACRPAAAGDAA